MVPGSLITSTPARFNSFLVKALMRPAEFIRDAPGVLDLNFTITSPLTTSKSFFDPDDLNFSTWKAPADTAKKTAIKTAEEILNDRFDFNLFD
ncbi:MAG: hypothetical protein A2297_05755 [Elusimicrobia bacterium RIFOXYB2_FULL_48_7]|nr:MAG: hypothetical protein A2297_05755 [Elusimicrobia bacterium RIFOXYB2_FULL_48_7]